MAKIQLVIEFDDATGAISMQGPLQQRMLCYGMLEMARTIVDKRGMETPAKPSSIVIPQLHGPGV